MKIRDLEHTAMKTNLITPRKPTEEKRNGHLLITDCVKMDERAQGGAGSTIERNTAKLVTKWEQHSDRSMKVEIETQLKEKINIIILYGPNENYKASIQNAF